MATILGLNAYHPDASAALLVDGKLAAAAEEERFTRVKHTGGFPEHAVRYCLQAAGVRPEDLDHIAVGRRRSAHLVHKALWAARLPGLARDRARAWSRYSSLKQESAKALGVAPDRLRARVHHVEHHLAHIASSFHASGMDRAALLSLDGLGDFASMRWGVGRGGRIEPMGKELFPHSVGFFYTAVTQYLGFPKFGDEYKVMGLGAYGKPACTAAFEDLIAPRGMGYRLDLRYFQHHRRQDTGMTWGAGEPRQQDLFSPEMERLLGGPARKPGTPVEQRHMDIAASLQQRLEQVVFRLLNELHDRTGLDRLCYAGGVAYNCVANGQVFEKTPFREVYIPPAAGDAGLAVGSALYVQRETLGDQRGFVMDHAYWGAEYEPLAVERAIHEAGLQGEKMDERSLTEATAERIEQGKVVGWFQGRFEFGPRALGNRSILVDPRRAEMKDVLNKRVKHREPFRPFAPSILEERTGDFFARSEPSPFMLMAYPVREERRRDIPAPTHVDGTARLQTVSRRTNPRYWDLIHAFGERTGVPVVLNTSFNENEPVVNTPQQAIACYQRTHMDVLALGPYLLEKRSP